MRKLAFRYGEGILIDCIDRLIGHDTLLFGNVDFEFEFLRVFFFFLRINCWSLLERILKYFLCFERF